MNGPVLGVDPGIGTTGWGVVAPGSGGRLHLVAAGTVRPDPGAPIGERLRTVHEGIVAALRLHRPVAVAVEEAFGGVNVRSAIRLGEARAVCLLAAAQAGLPAHELPPALVKKAVAGHGRAGKEAVRTAVLSALEAHAARLEDGTLVAELPYDAADALALALTALSRLEARGALQSDLPLGRRPGRGRRKWSSDDLERLLGG